MCEMTREELQKVFDGLLEDMKWHEEEGLSCTSYIKREGCDAKYRTCFHRHACAAWYEIRKAHAKCPFCLDEKRVWDPNCCTYNADEWEDHLIPCPDCQGDAE